MALDLMIEAIRREIRDHEKAIAVLEEILQEAQGLRSGVPADVLAPLQRNIAEHHVLNNARLLAYR
jgi:hypothetical protein